MALQPITFCLLLLVVVQLTLSRTIPKSDAIPVAPNVNDFHLGTRHSNSRLVSTEYFRSNEPVALYVAYSALQIDYVVARDQSTNSTNGAYVRYYEGGVRQTFVDLHFARRSADGVINFQIEIWSRPPIGFPVKLAADLVQGERRNGALFDVM